jgi:hypothetical protein
MHAVQPAARQRTHAAKRHLHLPLLSPLRIAPARNQPGHAAHDALTMPYHSLRECCIEDSLKPSPSDLPLAHNESSMRKSEST